MYDFICHHIPHIFQTLYTPRLINTTSLEEIRDALRPDQIRCKAWLFDRIQSKDKDSKILVIGSWIGFTSYCLFKHGFENITEVDIDDRLEPFARHLNHQNPQFKHITNDVNSINLAEYDIVINTSCEHITDNTWYNNIPRGTWVALQSTNFVSSDHVNTVGSIDDMKAKYPSRCDYMGELHLTPIFTRYMICGEKI